MDAQDSLDQEGQAGEVLEGGLDQSDGQPQESEAADEGLDENPSGKRPSGMVRLRNKARAQEREIRELHARMNDMQSRFQPQSEQPAYNPYAGQQQTGGMDEQIHKAVSYALQHRELEERKAREAENAAHVHRQYGDLQRHLDRTSDKYDDFDEVVRGDNAPFSPHMRDASLLLPKTGAGSAGEVLYKLGKNPEELSRIAKLHPLDQAAEMVKLSHALINGSENKSNALSRPLGNIKSNPVTNTHAVTEKTSVSDLRKRMRNGWK